MMKKLMLIGLMVLAVAAVSFAQTPTTNSDAAKAAEKAVLCKKCGEVKGSEKCCKPDTEKCSVCGLNKGSPGCKAACAEKK
jgi:hypothetical protein